jgi:hypothetical protein
MDGQGCLALTNAIETPATTARLGLSLLWRHLDRDPKRGRREGA